jgi:hypothetical protein
MDQERHGKACNIIFLQQKKPLMEKRRRARINVCYEKLKEILQQSDLQLK